MSGDPKCPRYGAEPLWGPPGVPGSVTVDDMLKSLLTLRRIMLKKWEVMKPIDPSKAIEAAKAAEGER